jgi:hypothetical protein
VTKDNRFRKHTMPLAFALLNIYGEWVYCAASVLDVLEWYRINRCEPGDPARVAFKADEPETWGGVATHMWKHDVELRRIEKPPVFTLAHHDLALDIAREGGRFDDDAPVLTEAETSARPRRMSITNPMARQ